MKRSVYFSTSSVLFIALVLLWIPWLGETLFYSKGEPREAIVAVSMLQSGDWILPVSCGTDIPYKPPFLAWLIAGFAWLFNGGVVNEYISRLPSALAAIALIMGGYTWARRARGERFALYMGLILATSVEFYRAAEACRVDMVLTACMVGAMYILYEIRERQGHDNFGRYCAAALLLTCATLTKGPVGSLLPCLAVGIYCLLRGDRFFTTLGRLTALCIASFVIPAVWYFYAWKSGGDLFLDTVWEENFQRLTGTMSYGSHVRPFYYNFATILIGMLPWTLLVIMAISSLRRLATQPFKPAGLFALTAALTVIIFYCFPSSKRSVYLLPAYPFMAYAVASLAEGISETRINSTFTRILAVLAILVPCVAIITQFYPIMDFRFQPQGWYSYIILFLPAAVSIGWQIQALPRGGIGGACLITWALLLSYSGALMPAVLNPLSDREDAQFLDALAADKPVYVVGPDVHTANAFNINFYMNDRVRRLKSAADADTCPKGTILIFVNMPDTAGLPDTYHLTLLKRRLADTRHPALFAVQTGTPIVRHAIDVATDTVVKQLPPEPEPVIAAPAHAAPAPRDTSAATRRPQKVKRIDRDSTEIRLYLPQQPVSAPPVLD